MAKLTMAKMMTRGDKQFFLRIAERALDETETLARLLRDDEGLYDAPHHGAREKLYEALDRLREVQEYIRTHPEHPPEAPHG